ncbi:MAG TPA: type I phosphomannose isomerase catalytic subunit [Verrucomicrobiales bacterium]|nr:type I phosphomannose isomerase catalytic subunit [Verrucomicrobiales bacterium]
MDEIVEALRFEPLYMKRVWGGRELERLFERRLPPDGQPYGESWELVDRAEEQSVVGSGRFSGLTLGELWRSERERIFGENAAGWTGRFPIIGKVLDARQRLSVQVHPPGPAAWELGGEPKSEMWHIVRAEPGACVYAGLKRGVGRREFEEGLAAGQTEDQIHSIPVRAGQFLYLPSGRLHAIGGGLVLFEIQQNSDTTYRVFDWNRPGLDGKPRPLQVEESLQCIDFSDVEPGMDEAEGECLVRCPWFCVDRWELGAGAVREVLPEGGFAVVAVVSGKVQCGTMRFAAGDWFLVPAAAEGKARELCAEGGSGAEILRTTLPMAIKSVRPT